MGRAGLAGIRLGIMQLPAIWCGISLPKLKLNEEHQGMQRLSLCFDFASGVTYLAPQANSESIFKLHGAGFRKRNFNLPA